MILNLTLHQSAILLTITWLWFIVWLVWALIKSMPNKNDFIYYLVERNRDEK